MKPIASKPIAIIGMGCRFPGGADSPPEFWNLLCQGFTALTDVPPDRWDARRFYDPQPDRPGKTYLRKGYFLRQPVDQFDAAFFGISPREAVFVDPLQRLMLEIVWESFEDAGLAPGRLANSPTGVFVGAFALDSLVGQMSAINRLSIDSHSATGATLAMLANRISYVYGFGGPSVALDTACSSSLVALHLACRSLQNGECELALAGGANVMVRPEYPMVMSKARFLAPDGRCKTFDEKADGYGRGEGAGVVLLKPLDAALADGDLIHAVILSTAVNQDGRTSGLSVPNGAAQEELLREAYRAAGVKPEQVCYLEAHGTGTAVGDPIEAQAMAAVLGTGRPAERPLLISSVKPNIGHLEAAAGVAGLIKTVLCLKHRQIPPHRGMTNPNPRIPFGQLGLRVPLSLEPLPATTVPAVAGINSFGYGGTNAHAVIQEAPPVSEVEVEEPPPGTPLILPLSTRGDDAMRAMVERHLDLLDNSPVSLRDLCYSAGLRDSRLEQRLAVVTHSTEELAGQLQTFLEGAPAAGLFTGNAPGRPPRPVFVYTGMGPQWWAMGRGLLESDAAFRATVERIDERFRALSADCSPLRDLLADESTSQMARTEVAQPTTFVLQTAMTELLRRWGIEPVAVVGHSVGEVAAAHIAGALSLDDAVRLSYHRSRLQGKARGQGRMLAVGLSEEETLAKLRGLEDRIEIAAVNGPTSITLAGEGPALEQLAQTLTIEGTFNRFLAVEVAYHSRQMEPIRDELLDSLRELQPRSGSIPFYSTVTGQLADTRELDAGYWYRNVRQAVRFADAMDRILADGFELLVEVGPHPALSTSVTQCVRRRGSTAVIVPTLQRKKPDVEAMLESVCQLFAVGCPVEWKAFYPLGGRRVKLPAYPWQRTYHWSETDESRQDRLGGQAHPLLGLSVKGPQPTREVELSAAQLPYLADHRIRGRAVFPGAGYVETSLALGHDATASTGGDLEEIEFHKILLLDPSAVVHLRSSFEPDQGRVLIHSRTRKDWTLHATARFVARSSARENAEADRPTLPLEQLRAHFGPELAVGETYRGLARQGLEYGPAFQGIHRLWRSGTEVLAQVQISETADLEQYILHPTLLDAAFQAIAVVAADSDTGTRNGLYLPVAIDRIRVHGKPGPSAWVFGRVTSCNGRSVIADLRLCDDSGLLLAEVCGVRFQAVPSERGGSTDNLLYNFTWRAAAGQPATSPDRGRPSLILADRSGVGERLAAELKQRGDAPILLPPDTDGLPSKLADLLASASPPARIVCLWGLDVSTLDSQADPNGPLSAPGVGVLSLYQTLAGISGDVPRWWIVTRGSQTVDEQSPTMPAGATLWGLGRVLAAEHPGLRCSLADLDAADGIALLADELLSDSPESEVAFRNGARFVRRAERVEKLPEPVARVTADEADPSVRLAVGRTGLDSLRFRRHAAREPGPGEVTIRVRAAGLNFKDVLKAMGVLSERIVDGTMSGQALGLECAGTVVGVGPGVEKFRVGDDVIACSADCFRTHLTLASDMVFAKIPQLSFAEEAALPVVFLTAHYSLNVIGRLARGERVLIHAATGGVGLAAIQVARRAGAEIFATAGSPEKREFLHSLGIEHVMDSRSLEFADQIMEKTAGQGVDVVLNSLTGQALTKSLAVLAPYGRFIEIGKRDIDENNPLRLRPFNRNLSFSSIDIDRLIVERPKQARELMEEVRSLFRSGEFRPLPVQVFPASQAANAFRHLGQAKHIGKVVLSLEDAAANVADDEPAFRPDATYLVTGGLGGVGLKLAEWLAEHGARRLVLVGRSGAATEEARRVVGVLERRGVTVQAIAADVSRRADVDSLLAGIPPTAPLRGVFHAAMVLDDGLALQVTRERYEKVLMPKAVGAWHLHAATAGLPLDYFMCFSSVVAELGNPGQGAYAAANAFLDALASFRRGSGLPGLSVNWGAFGDAGVVARNEQLATHLSRQGWNGIPVQRAFETLGAVMNRPLAQVAIADVDWQVWGTAAPSLAGSPRFAELVAKTSANGSRSGDSNWRDELFRLEPEQRLAAVVQRAREAVAQVLGLDPAKLDAQRRLDQLGLASLMAVELQHVLTQRTGVVISAMDMMQGPSVADLAKLLLSRLTPAAESKGTGPEPADAGIAPHSPVSPSSTHRPQGAFSGSGGPRNDF